MSEDEGSPPRPARRRIKKVLVISSGSESESDDSVIIAQTRRKRMRVVSDDGASSGGSSGSAVVASRKRSLPALRDSDSDTSGWATDHSDAPPAPESAPAAPKPASGFASDSSEGNSDKCSICLLRFKDQEIGTPESCEHIFCVDCIVEWSKNVNTCPVDRMTFNSIVVRTCIGGRVLRTEPVKVERRPSVEVLVVEDPTPCEICGSTENEESMLLCDGCDLGFHMQCLTPPLTQVPVDQWLCPSCDELLETIHLSELEDLFTGIEDLDLPDGPRDVPLREPRQPRNVRRSSRNRHSDEPSTSSGRTRSSGNVEAAEAVPSTSRGTRSRSSRSSVSRAPRRRTTGTTRRKPQRRRAKTVVIEYEVQGNGKFPITKTVKRRVKKRKSRKRQPRTAARRSHVRASVRAKLADMTLQHQNQALQLSSAASGVQELCTSRQRAGIPALSLFGNPHQLDYFSEEEYDVAEGTSVAVAARPNHSAISAYRQARRKMVSIPSPGHAPATPDILSSILESQTLLHSKKSVMSISVDGQVDIKLERRERERSRRPNPVESRPDPTSAANDRLDVTKGTGEDKAKKTPSYPGGHHQRSGGWGGGYRGGRVPPAAPHAHAYSGGPGGVGGPAGRGGPFYPHSDSMPTDYARRPPFSPADDFYDRNRQQNGRDRFQQRERPERGRYSGPGPAWRGGYNRDRDFPPPARHSFGDFENPIDMRTGPPSPPYSANITPEFSRNRPPFTPLPEPPRFHFGNKPEEEEEPEVSELVIDTDKYDPTDPTHDDDSADEDPPSPPLQPPPSPPVFPVSTEFPSPPPVLSSRFPHGSTSAELPARLPGPTPLLSPKFPSTTPLAYSPLRPPPLPEVLTSVANSVIKCPPPPPAPPIVQSILAEIDTSSLNVPHNVVDTAVRQVLEEHRQHLIDQPQPPRSDYSGEDSDGDCPNFSIYSATSVHIASTSNMEEIAHSATVTATTTVQDDEYNAKVSKICPITQSTRNAIKIKLNSHSLIKRPATLDEDEKEEPGDDVEANYLRSEPATPESDPQTPDKQRNISEAPEEEPPQIPADITNTDKPDDVMDDDKIEDNAEVASNAIEDIKISEPSEEETSLPPSSTNAELPPSQREGVDEQDSPKEEMPISPDSTDAELLPSQKNGEDREQDPPDEEMSIPPDSTDAELPTSQKEGEDDEQDPPEEKIDSSLDSTDAELPTLQKEKEDDEQDPPEEEIPIRLDSTDAELTISQNEGGDHEQSPPVAEEASTENECNELDGDDTSEKELQLSPVEKGDAEQHVEKMTESISETEDERSYTPCLDENKSKDTSHETEKETGIEGLDTEMISEEEGQDMFSDGQEPTTTPPTSPTPADDKKKKKKESKKENKDKKNKLKKSDVTFKKLSKTSKERNYRDKDKTKDKDTDKNKKDKSDAAAEKKAKRKEKRKDLERYDVRTVVSEKRKRVKDAFGRDVSPPPSDAEPGSPPPPPRRRRHSSSPPRKRSSSPRRSPSPKRRKSHSPRHSHSKRRKSKSPRRRSRSRRRSWSKSPLRRRSKSLRYGATPPRNRSVSVSPLRPRSKPLRPVTPHQSPSPSPRRSTSVLPLRTRSKPLRPVSPASSRSSKSISSPSRPPRAVTPTTRERRLRTLSPHRRPPQRERPKSPPPRRRSPSPPLRRHSPSPPPRRSRSKSMSPRLRRLSSAPRHRSPSPRKKSFSPKRKSVSPRRRSISRGRKRRSTSRGKKRRRSGSRSPRPKGKKKKADRSPKRRTPKRKSPKRKSPKRKRRRERSPSPVPPERPPARAYTPALWSPPSVDSRLLSPRTPPPGPEPLRRRHRQARGTQPSKEVFTSGDNILVSVSFDQERNRSDAEKQRRKEAKKNRRKRRRRAAAAEMESNKPVAIIDLERSPFRELTPSPKNVIVLSDSEHEAEPEQRHASTPAPAHAPPEHAHVGPKTPPDPPHTPAAPPKFTVTTVAARIPALTPIREEAEPEPSAVSASGGSVASPNASGGGPGPSTPPDSPDAYDPFEPTRSPSPAAVDEPTQATSPPRTTMTLEAAQKTNMSADEVIDRRPVSPIEKVMALLQSTRDVSPEPPPGDASHSQPPPQTPAALLPPPTNIVQSTAPTATAAPRIVLPSPTRSAPPKLFLAKPSPIKSNPVKPMQATKISRLPLPLGAVVPRAGMYSSGGGGDSPYSPGSSDFGDLFEPPPSRTKRQSTFDALFDKPAKRRTRSSAAKVPVRLNRKKGKMQVGVKIDEDNLKILDDLPSSAVEMQVKSKFLKKLNRQERVVEEVKLVLKPHYNKKHVTKEEYKDILRRAVPKICHNKSGEINPSKIQSLVEAYVKKFRKKHKLGLA